MKQLLPILIILFLTGCASHYRQESLETPLSSVHTECHELGNGSTSCVKRVKSEVDSRYGNPYGVPPVMYAEGYAAPPVLMLHGQSEAAASMERIPGGITVLHPADLRSGGDPRVDKHEENLDALNRGLTKVVRKIKKEHPKK